MATRIVLYYDVVSPYSWMAFEVLNRYESLWKLPVDYVPFVLGGVMKATSNVPPGSNPFKARYMGKGMRLKLNERFGTCSVALWSSLYEWSSQGFPCEHDQGTESIDSDQTGASSPVN